MKNSSTRANVNLPSLVMRVADRFEYEYDVKVSSETRKLLISQANPYEDHVMTELARGKITLDFLEDSLHKLLRNAYNRALSQNQREIDLDIIRESMAEFCPYLFWC